MPRHRLQRRDEAPLGLGRQALIVAERIARVGIEQIQYRRRIRRRIQIRLADR